MKNSIQDHVNRLWIAYGKSTDGLQRRTTDKGNPILDDDVLEQLPYPEAKQLAEYMLVKKRLGQISRWQRMLG